MEETEDSVRTYIRFVNRKTSQHLTAVSYKWSYAHAEILQRIAEEYFGHCPSNDYNKRKNLVCPWYSKRIHSRHCRKEILYGKFLWGTFLCCFSTKVTMMKNKFAENEPVTPCQYSLLRLLLWMLHHTALWWSILITRPVSELWPVALLRGAAYSYHRETFLSQRFRTHPWRSFS